jgi:hypothetical protein
VATADRARRAAPGARRGARAPALAAVNTPRATTARPADVCRELLAALDASEGRRRRRKRDTTPDAIGHGMKRALLESAVTADPEPSAFEGWLLERCLAAGGEAGAMRAMAREVLEEWRLAQMLPDFGAWLGHGAPSADAERD